MVEIDVAVQVMIANYLNMLHMVRIQRRKLMQGRWEHIAKALWHLRRRKCLIAMWRTRIVNRRIWKLNRSSTFWEERLSNGPEKFKEDFRMWPSTFEMLCEQMKGLERRSTTYREAIPVEKRVGIAIYAPASSAEYRSIANLFGVGRTTVGKIVLEFCREVWKVMRDEYLSFYNKLDDEKLEECVDGFEALGFPQCCGAIDGCHIAVLLPAAEACDHYNFKGWHSVILLATVDYRYRFTYINIGTPGRNRDSYVFETSKLYELHTQNPIFANKSKQYGSCNVPIMLIGDSGFALRSVLMKPYPECYEMTDKEKLFNYKLSAARRVVENAFGHVKARFRKLGRELEVDISNVNTIAKACCVLHNFLNAHNDETNQRWVAEMQAFERNEGRQQPQTTNNTSTAEGEQIREAIAEHLQRMTQTPNIEDDGPAAGDDVPVTVDNVVDGPATEDDADDGPVTADDGDDGAVTTDDDEDVSGCRNARETDRTP